jgi:hypothetical protein
MPAVPGGHHGSRLGSTFMNTAVRRQRKPNASVSGTFGCWPLRSVSCSFPARKEQAYDAIVHAKEEVVRKGLTGRHETPVFVRPPLPDAEH